MPDLGIIVMAALGLASIAGGLFCIAGIRIGRNGTIWIMPLIRLLLGLLMIYIAHFFILAMINLRSY